MKKTREYYTDLVDLEYTNGRVLTRGEEDSVCKHGVPENVISTQEGLIAVEDIDAEEFLKKSNFLMIRRLMEISKELHTIKLCLLFLSILAGIAVAASTLSLILTAILSTTGA